MPLFNTSGNSEIASMHIIKFSSNYSINGLSKCTAIKELWRLYVPKRYMIKKLF